MEAGWQSWNWDTVHREIDSLPTLDVIGLLEADVRGRFGEHVVTPGSEEANEAGSVLFRAEADLRYYRLLPRTCLSTSVAEGRAARLSWWPKWKRCPPGSPVMSSDVICP